MIGFTAEKLQEIQNHLNQHPYLSQGGLPGVKDAQIYFELKQLPDVIKTPNTHYWYLFIKSFSDNLMKRWITKSIKPERKFQGKKKEKLQKKSQVQVQNKKQEKKQQTSKPVEQGDLFDDEPVVVVPIQKSKTQVVKKKKVIAKSIVLFDVKVYEKQTDLDELAKKILLIQMDGLVWNKDPKKQDVAYGIQKLRIGCVIEDDKILTDDIFETIQTWEEVQSTDMVSMQKV